MAMETAAAILTKLAVEQNNDFRAKLSSARGRQNHFGGVDYAFVPANPFPIAGTTPG